MRTFSLELTLSDGIFVVIQIHSASSFFNLTIILCYFCPYTAHKHRVNGMCLTLSKNASFKKKIINHNDKNYIFKARAQGYKN